MSAIIHSFSFSYTNTVQLRIIVGWVEGRRRGAASRRVTQHFRFAGFHDFIPNLRRLGSFSWILKFLLLTYMHPI